jgi:hypothetical protein
MANDALAQSGIDIGLSGEADYDTVYAAVTATERGRWFLTELANRNRRSETDALMAAIGRIETVVRGDMPAKQPAFLPDIGVAAERLAGLAFALRERGADRTLCDALDAAVREICAACGNDAKNKESATGAGLAGLNRSAPADRDIAQPAREAADDIVDADSLASGETFDLPLQDSAQFAAAATALAASLTTLNEEPQGADDPQSPSSAAAAIPPHDYEAESAPQRGAAKEQHGPRWHIEAPDFVFHAPQHGASDRGLESSTRSDRPQALLPGLQLLPSPDEDPAELFEPRPKHVATPPRATPATSPAKPPTPLASAVTAAAQAVRAAQNPSPPRNPTGPTVRPMPGPLPINPLAALRALTEEELIALFG